MLEWRSSKEKKTLMGSMLRVSQELALSNETILQQTKKIKYLVMVVIFIFRGMLYLLIMDYSERERERENNQIPVYKFERFILLHCNAATRGANYVAFLLNVQSNTHSESRVQRSGRSSRLLIQTCFKF